MNTRLTLFAFPFVYADQGWASLNNDNNEYALVETGNDGIYWEVLNPLEVPQGSYLLPCAEGLS